MLQRGTALWFSWRGEARSRFGFGERSGWGGLWVACGGFPDCAGGWIHRLKEHSWSGRLHVELRTLGRGLRILRVEGARTLRWAQMRCFVQILKRRSGMVSGGFGARVRLGFTDAERVGTVFGGLRKGAPGSECGRGWLRSRAEAPGDD